MSSYATDIHCVDETFFYEGCVLLYSWVFTHVDFPPVFHRTRFKIQLGGYFEASSVLIQSAQTTILVINSDSLSAQW